ncbi:MAG: hypothetical protein VB089_18980 [Anaerolineaceae bacterium]|nr:hypothetical protein [Anaerolineaceae bacterium]
MTLSLNDVAKALSPTLEADERILHTCPAAGQDGTSWNALTDRRLFLRRGAEMEERRYLYTGENVEAYEIGRFVLSGDVHLLTGRRLLVMDLAQDGTVLANQALQGIESLDMTLIYSHKIAHVGFTLGMQNERRLSVVHGDIRTPGAALNGQDLVGLQVVRERLPRRLCELAGIPFAPPQYMPYSGAGAMVSFYLKADLRWPQYCAACMERGEVLKPHALKLRRNGNVTAADRLAEQALLEIPYCASCYRERFGWLRRRPAVQEYSGFNGVRAALWFESRRYAAEFVRLNRQ